MHKLRYFMDFWKRTTLKKSQKDLLKIIKTTKKKSVIAIQKTLDTEVIDFVKMILLDAIFIIELFLKTKEEEKEEF
jgi:protein tyrosine phosphatase